MVGMVCFMRTLVLQLFNRKNRPSFRYVSSNVTVDALIDTGAETPVWCKGEKKLLLAYPDAVKQNWKSEIRGFGKDAEEATVYAIPEFSLSDGKECYKIQNLLIAVCNHPLIGYDLILSDTMFSKADTYIHRIANKFVEIVFEKDIYQCASKRGNDSFSIVTFAQEDGAE